MLYFMITFIMSMLLMVIFFTLSKSTKWEMMMNSSFECGFNSYFYSRFSFSIHFFMISLTFLFLDLELCCLMPFFNEEMSMTITKWPMILFLALLIMGLIKEWNDGMMEWKT